MENKSVFKVEDRVFDFCFGWGKIVTIDTGWMKIRFDNSKRDAHYEQDDLKTLSFTEYTLEGFSQKRPEELPKKGDIVWGRNEFPSEWHIGHFYDKLGDNYLISSHPQPTGWNNIVKEITTKNPY